LPFHDSDRHIASTLGVSISTIFEIEGEAGFRERERQALKELAAGATAVIATGGGAILLQENRRLFRETGIAVYLRAPLDLLLERVQRDHTRPLFAGTQASKTLELLHQQREPLYQCCSDLIIEVRRQHSSATVSEVASRLAAHSAFRT
jgi:shikimate kinase